MLQKDTLEYVIGLRRELHQYPEIGFDLPKTLALVRRELDKLGVPYTEEFGKSSIVATINPECKGVTIGIRGDMDALPMQEETGLPFASKIPGQMHACGHDGHTAMLIGMAKELKAREKELACRVKLLFTPAEEYIEPGCKLMAEDGVMDDIDFAVSCHVGPDSDTGRIAIRNGGINANSMGFTVEFFGTSSHAASQQKGKDAIAMAVEAYTAMEIMVAKEFSPNEPRLFNIGVIQGGQTNNIICNYCKMFGSSRAHSDEVSEKLITRVREICEGIAKMNGGEAKVTVNKFLPYVLNNDAVAEQLRISAKKIVGDDNVFVPGRGLGGEDFGFLSRKKPCAFFRLGTRCSEATSHVLHTVKFDLDENALAIGMKIFLQFVLDNQNGIAF
ncbi:MAG: amidohydrolase [Oscillospiraceae bacterium]|nr:amidohydrolase [Oscillospiraceae bacterium]